VYVCPKCKTETGFEWADFLKHVGSPFSNLVYQDRQAVEREVAHRLKDENGLPIFIARDVMGLSEFILSMRGQKRGFMAAGWRYD
jgi:hypothetical protein